MIRFREVCLSFGERKVFDNFRMDVATGEKVLLTAPSGSGKSTLFKLLLGFEKPDSGNIELDGEALSRESISRFREKIAYVSQDVDFPDMVIRDLVRGIFSYKINRHLAVTEKSVLDLFNIFELPAEFLDKNVGQLSGGERQRLGLVVAILLDRPILLLDEITSGLDTTMKKSIVSYILNLPKTVLVISHDRVWARGENIRIQEL